MNKTAVIILADPKPGTDEALGRLFNALITAYDAKRRGDDVTVLFHGAGTRWAGLITDKSHPANPLYEAVKDRIAGVSCGCADVFGARETAEDNGFTLVRESPIPGTSGVPSIASRLAEGYRVVTF
jgi:hypothetical protein